MISETEVSDILEKQIPGFKYESEKISGKNSIYKVIQCFTDYTENIIQNENLQNVKICFETANILFINGNKAIKNAIENVFLYTIADFLDSRDNEKIKNLLPKELRRLRIQLIYSN